MEREGTVAIYMNRDKIPYTPTEEELANMALLDAAEGRFVIIAGIGMREIYHSLNEVWYYMESGQNMWRYL